MNHPNSQSICCVCYPGRKTSALMAAMEDLLTAISELEETALKYDGDELATALESLDLEELETALSTTTDYLLSTCLSATASEYSIPASETDAELPAPGLAGLKTALSTMTDDDYADLRCPPSDDRFLDRMASLTPYKSYGSDYSLLELATALESLEPAGLKTALSSTSLTAREALWSEAEDELSTCLSATASEYSLPESETDVEPTLLFRVGQTAVRDGVHCLSKLKNYEPVPAEIGEGLLCGGEYQDYSFYEMPPSETDVTMAEVA